MTKDALKAISQSEIEKGEIESAEQTLEMNLRFIKPSHNFYNQIMSNWFKYVHLIIEDKEINHDSDTLWNNEMITKKFIEFCENDIMKKNIGQQ